MIVKNPEKSEEVLLKLAEAICLAARTAPKAKGIDNLTTMVISGKEKDLVADKMDEIAKKYEHQGFTRDAKNVRQAKALILIGTKLAPIDLRLCGLCGNVNCAGTRKKNDICIFNSLDLGIAIGSAVSKAMDMKIDNRIMYSVGWAAREMKLLDEENKIIIGIPLSATGKNPFFDRK